MTGREKLNALMTEFDEMGYAPTTLCSDPEDTVRDWKVNLMSAIGQIEQEARKQAAKGILQILYNHTFEVINFNPFAGGESFGTISQSDLLSLAKQCGVEIDE